MSGPAREELEESPRYTWRLLLYLLVVILVFSCGVVVRKIILADEISPDSCRLWDSKSKTKLDKDVFRKGISNLIDAYEEVASRLGIVH